MNSFTYTASKNMINLKMYKSKEQMAQMLQIFAMAGDLTPDQYTELSTLLATH
mgnify:CR=1 FL=1